MYILKTSSCFDSAHFLKDYDGKCANIHGHRWMVEIEIADDKLSDTGKNKGMVVDFSQLKDDLSKLTDYFDHSLIIEKNSLKEKTKAALLEENFRIIEVDFRPTAENFSRYFYEQMKSMNYKVIKACVYETPKNCATYCEGIS